jgi:hypothetical protein
LNLQLLICGQPLRVNYTTRDVIEHWDKPLHDIVVLTDGETCRRLFCTYALDYHAMVSLISCMFYLYRLLASTGVYGGDGRVQAVLYTEVRDLEYYQSGVRRMSRQFTSTTAAVKCYAVT